MVKNEIKTTKLKLNTFVKDIKGRRAFALNTKKFRFVVILTGYGLRRGVNARKYIWIHENSIQSITKSNERTVKNLFDHLKTCYDF